MESASSLRASSLMRPRVWYGLGSIRSSAISCEPPVLTAGFAATKDRPGRRESRPRPSALRLSVSLFMSQLLSGLAARTRKLVHGILGCLEFGRPLDQLLGQADVALSSARADVIKQRRFAIAGSFGQPDVARDDRAQQFLVEEFLQFLRDLLRQRGAVVIHGQHHALDLQLRVEALAQPLDGIEQLAHALQSKVLGLHGNED